MSHHHSHLSSAVKAIKSHKKDEPLVHHLKRFFAADKKYGSKDRKQITTLCYNFYRLGTAKKEESIEERIIISTFLCSNISSPFLQEVKPEFNDEIDKPLSAKVSFLQIDFHELFPFFMEVGEGIAPEKYALSFLNQPLFYLRIRPGFQAKVLEKLTKEKIDFDEITTSCIALQQGFKTADFFTLNKEVVVQDRNSQQVFSYLQQPDVFLKKEIQVWDCCAASGGKSILLNDLLLVDVHLHVSDVRANILQNLSIRFKEAGIKKYESFTADLLNGEQIKINKKFNLIICDAPCSGSGTWARTPEQTSFFSLERINEYAEKQLKIASAAIEKLENTGLFFYITCSVFKKENEDVVTALKQKFHLQVLQMEYVKGYEVLADTMFVAVLSF